MHEKENRETNDVWPQPLQCIFFNSVCNLFFPSASQHNALWFVCKFSTVHWVQHTHTSRYLSGELVSGIKLWFKHEKSSNYRRLLKCIIPMDCTKWNKMHTTHGPTSMSFAVSISINIQKEEIPKTYKIHWMCLANEMKWNALRIWIASMCAKWICAWNRAVCRLLTI